jgi:hypothetical protein
MESETYRESDPDSYGIATLPDCMASRRVGGPPLSGACAPTGTPKPVRPAVRV